jgi:hypothetical protein
MMIDNVPLNYLIPNMLKATGTTLENIFLTILSLFRLGFWSHWEEEAGSGLLVFQYDLSADFPGNTADASIDLLYVCAFLSVRL